MRRSSDRLARACALGLTLVACGKEFSAAPPKDSPDGSAGGNAASGGAPSGGGVPAASSGGGAGRGSGGAGVVASDSGAGGVVSSAEAGADAAPPAPEISTNGLVLWLRADRGVTEQNGGVSVWADQSPLHQDAAQATPNLRPRLVSHGISSRPSVSFDGVDDYLRLPPGFEDFDAGLTILAVAQVSAPPTYGAIFEASNSPEVDDISLGLTPDQINFEVFDGYQAGKSFEFDKPQLFGGVLRTSTFFQIRRNGDSEGEGTMPLPTKITRQESFVGRSLYAGADTLSGLISEVVLYDRALTDSEILAVEGVLAARWACCTN